MYWDANNLYGYAMSQKLPYKNFKWVNIHSLSELASDKGYILEVDLEYPVELHDNHNEYPLAVEHFNMKLCPNLFNKKNYIVYIKNLEFYIKNGLVLTKIHRVLEFDEKAWLEPYINFNAQKRKVATSKFEKDFYKLMNNAVYGKNSSK